MPRPGMNALLPNSQHRPRIDDASPTAAFKQLSEVFGIGLLGLAALTYSQAQTGDAASMAAYGKILAYVWIGWSLVRFYPHAPFQTTQLQLHMCTSSGGRRAASSRPANSWARSEAGSRAQSWPPSASPPSSCRSQALQSPHHPGRSNLSSFCVSAPRYPPKVFCRATRRRSERAGTDHDHVAAHRWAVT
eukprot:scaffold103900_cov63-Phaeocystis_antarctica.AAC.3